MIRRWIIGKDGRRCGNWNCIGHEKANAKILRIEDSGVVHLECLECDAPHSYQSRDYKDERACKGCAYVRDVTVHVYHDGKEYARDYCDACDAEQSAARHVEMAKHLRRKAQTIRQRRAGTATETQS